MRRLLPLLLAALVACQVDVEGAPCTFVAGRTGYAPDCPAGQGCGLDQRCSTRAASAGCALCAPGEPRCEGTQIQECSAASDPVCGGWETTTQCEGGLVCGMSSGARACVCPPNEGPTFAVAAPGSVTTAGPTPTGASEPPECRFRTLTGAIAIAADAGGGTVVAVGGSTGQTPVLFGDATGETLPLDVPAGVTVTSDFSSSGAVYAIQLDEAEATSAVRMHAGAALAGFVIQNVAGDSTRDAIALACDGTNVPVRLDSVTLRGEGPDAEHRLKRGIHVSDECGVVGTDVVISGMQAEALQVEATDPATESTFLRGAFERNGKGVHLKQGLLKLDGVRVEGNTGIGIEAGALTGISAVELNGVRVLRNGDTGISAVNNRRLLMTDTTVFGNMAKTEWGGQQTPSKISRRCGGIVFRGAPPPSDGESPTLRFERNRVYANEGDQLLVLTSTTPWQLGAQSCTTDSGSSAYNLLACYDTTPPNSGVTYRGLVVIDSIADARNTAWQTLLPSSGTDFHAYGTGAQVSLGIDDAEFCTPELLVNCSSPDPQ